MLKTALFEVGETYFCKYAIYNLLFPLADSLLENQWSLNRWKQEALARASRFYQIENFAERCPQLTTILYSTLESVFGKN